MTAVEDSADHFFLNRIEAGMPEDLGESLLCLLEHPGRLMVLQGKRKWRRGREGEWWNGEW
jgi:hypothetical protein